LGRRPERFVEPPTQVSVKAFLTRRGTKNVKFAKKHEKKRRYGKFGRKGLIKAIRTSIRGVSFEPKKVKSVKSNKRTTG